jgi:beta-glucanase (GH16 family)
MTVHGGPTHEWRSLQGASHARCSCGGGEDSCWASLGALLLALWLVADSSNLHGHGSSAPSPSGSIGRGGAIVRSLRKYEFAWALSVGVVVLIFTSTFWAPQSEPTPTLTPTPTPTGEPAPIAGQGYTKVFGDEFDGTSLDLTKWKPAWYFADPGPQNYQVANGLLSLTSRRSEGYRKVELNSVHLDSGTPMRSWTYGYFEARAKWPRGRGNWSAFWLNNLEHQVKYQAPFACPKLWSEINIYENIWESPHTQWTTLHRNTNNRCGVPDETRPAITWMRCDTDATPCDLTADFHTYAVLWEPTRIRWYRDGALIQSRRFHSTVADVLPFDSTDQPMFLNLWLHACDWSGRCPDASTPDVMTHQFDWVRVWQK